MATVVTPSHFPLATRKGNKLFREQLTENGNSPLVASLSQHLHRKFSYFYPWVVARGANQNRNRFVFWPAADRPHRLLLQLEFRTSVERIGKEAEALISPVK